MWGNLLTALEGVLERQRCPTVDTSADSLIMTRPYSRSHRDPVRTLFFNIATTTTTVAIALVVATVYASGLAS
jgi:high-affinity nickel-transport protein